MARNEWPWLRLYSEARSDAKLRSLSDAQHRIWFNLLCYAGEQPVRGVIHESDEFMLAIECADGDEALLRHTLQTLERLRIIAFGNDEDAQDTIRFLAWEDRQYDKPSDRPEATAERKRRSREKQERPANTEDVSRGKEAQSRGVTPSHDPEKEKEQELETEREKEKTHDAPAARVRVEYPPEFEVFWLAYPRGHGDKKPTFAAWKAVPARERGEVLAGVERWKTSERWQRGIILAADQFLKRGRWKEPIPEAAARASPQNGKNNDPRGMFELAKQYEEQGL